MKSIPPLNTALARFAEAYRKKQVLLFNTYAPPRKFGMLSNKGGNDWALPSISFGQLDDMANSSEAWTKTVADEAWKEGAAHVLAGTFSLPFEECIYLFHYEETTQKYETINLLYLVTSGNEITGECYFWQPSAPGTMSQWTKDPWQFTIINGAGVEWAIEPHFEGQIPASMAQDYKEDAKSSYTKVICATMLLGHGGKSSEPIEYVSGVNRGRALGKLAPLPDTITVRFDHAAIRQAYPAGGFSGAKQPHDRRGHYRTLASGKVIPVKPSKIHGGAATPRNYVVEGVV